LVVFTHGSEPTIVASSEGTIQEFSVPPVPKEEIVDTNGAGDSFVGGFLARYSTGTSLEEAVAAGNYTAGMTIRTSGTNFKGRTSAFTFSKN
jgi:adenosine kinase